MIKIDVKPLSVNAAWKGRRHKTSEYKAYEKEVMYKLPPNIHVPDGPLYIYIEWGFSSAGSDFDNPIKPFVDILQKKYGFNDNRIHDSRIKKVKVKKGSEYIRFKLSEAE